MSPRRTRLASLWRGGGFLGDTESGLGNYFAECCRRGRWSSRWQSQKADKNRKSTGHFSLLGSEDRSSTQMTQALCGRYFSMKRRGIWRLTPKKIKAKSFTACLFGRSPQRPRQLCKGVLARPTTPIATHCDSSPKFECGVHNFVGIFGP